MKILNDEMQCDVIKIGGLVRNKVSSSDTAMTAPEGVSIEGLLAIARGAMFCDDVADGNVFLVGHRRSL